MNTLKNKFAKLNNIYVRNIEEKWSPTMNE